MTTRIDDNGWAAHNIWQHSADTFELYRRRARDEAEEMTCAAQAAELIAEVARPGESLLDAGCGTGYFFHSLRRRGIALEYHGIDATAPFIALGRSELAAFIERYGFTAREVADRRSGGQPEMVIGHPHHWTFLVATRR